VAFTIAYRNELDDTERDAALAVARRMGASVTWQSDALSNRTYALVERAGVTAAAAFRAALHGTVHDAPIMALALYPSIPEALPSLVNALAGPGAPVGVIGCERCGDGLILEVDLDRTPIEIEPLGKVPSAEAPHICWVVEVNHQIGIRLITGDAIDVDHQECLASQATSGRREDYCMMGREMGSINGG